MLRVTSSLSEADEQVIGQVISRGLRVRRTLGPGFLESIYRNALSVELRLAALPFEFEKTVVVRYRELPVGSHRLDFVVAGIVILELKAVKELEGVHYAQVLSYLKATGLRVGVLMNFGAPTLKSGLRRIIF